MLNVLGTKEMYEAWENMYHNTIEDYQTNEGDVSQAIKVDWITKLPKVFCMQLNRLKYEEGNPVKILDPMIIEKTLYVDRFLIQNREQSEKIREFV